MSKKHKTVVIVVAAAVAAYLLYRWYMNRQAGGSPTGQLGTNLNSIAPELVAGSTGPNSGLNYYQGSTTIFLTENISQQGKSGTGNRTWPLKPSPIPPRVVH